MRCSKRFVRRLVNPRPAMAAGDPRHQDDLPVAEMDRRHQDRFALVPGLVEMLDAGHLDAAGGPQAVDHRVFVHGAPDIAPQPVHRRIDRSGVGRLGAQRGPRLAGARFAFRIEAAGEIGDRGAGIGAHVDRHRPHGIMERELGGADHGIAQPVAAGDPPLIGVAEEPAQRGRRTDSPAMVSIPGPRRPPDAVFLTRYV